MDGWSKEGHTQAATGGEELHAGMVASQRRGTRCLPPLQGKFMLKSPPHRWCASRRLGLEGGPCAGREGRQIAAGGPEADADR